MLETEREQDNLLLRTICAGRFFWTTRQTLKDLMMASPVTSTTLIKTQCLSTFHGTELLILLVILKAYRPIQTSSLTNTKASCLSESVHLLTASSYQKSKHEVRKRKEKEWPHLHLTCHTRFLPEADVWLYLSLPLHLIWIWHEDRNA